MKDKLCGLLCLLSVASLLPAAAQAEECTSRFSAAFARLRGYAPRATDQNRANLEVTSLFGSRPDVCEAGAYQRFMDEFKDFAREALRSWEKSKDQGMLRLAAAAIQQAPMRVPVEETKAAVTVFRQTRSDVYAIADDLKGKTLLIDDYLQKIFAGGPPSGSGPPPPVTPPSSGSGSSGSSGSGSSGSGSSGSGNSGATMVRVPVTPLPPWAVVSLYEMKDNLKSQDIETVKGKLEAILKWIETSP